MKHQTSTHLSSWILAAVVLGATTLALAGNEQPGQAAPWAETVFHSDFELGELEDPARPALTALRFLERWQQKFSVPDLPNFMVGSLVRPAPEGHGHRYLQVPLDGARAFFASKSELALRPLSYLHVSAFLRWDDVGDGYWRLELHTPEDRRLTLLEGRGAQPEWREHRADMVVPEGFERGHLELSVAGQPGKVGGKLGIDDVLLRWSPRIIWSFAEPMRRVDPEDEYPLQLRSVGLPPGTYDLELRVLDEGGTERLHEKRTRLVGESFPIDFAPRFHWSRNGLAGGIYTVHLRLANRDDGQELREMRSFVLAARTRFPRVARGLQWGVELPPGMARDGDHSPPPWLTLVRPERVAVTLDGRGGDAGLPAWLKKRRDFQRAVIIDPSRWPADADPDLASIVADLRRVFWKVSADLARGQQFLTGLAGDAPFLEIGFRLPPGVRQAPVGKALVTPVSPKAADLLGVPPGDGPWSVRADLSSVPHDRQASQLAVALYSLASLMPECIYLVDPDPLFVDRETGELSPRSPLLVWEFVVGFLSGARFGARESWDPEGTCLTFVRDGEEFLVVFTEGEPHEILLEGGEAVGYTSVGARGAIGLDDDGLTRIPVSRDPLLVQGLDLERVRTFRSVRASVEDGGRGRRSQRIVISLHNHFSNPVRAVLELDIPRLWEVLSPLEPRRIDADARGELVMVVHVPASLGIDGPARLEGTLELEDPNGVFTRVPVSLDVPIESPLVEIRSVGVGPTDADFLVRNKSDRLLELRVNLLLSDGGPEQTRYHQRLAPGEQRSYRIQYSPSTSDRRLWLGVAINSPEGYVNRTYTVPASR